MADLRTHRERIADAENHDFTLKAQDALAPFALLEWICRALEHNARTDPPTRHLLAASLDTDPRTAPRLIPAEKVAGACEHLADIIRQQDEYGSKLPD